MSLCRKCEPGLTNQINASKDFRYPSKIYKSNLTLISLVTFVHWKKLMVKEQVNLHLLHVRAPPIQTKHTKMAIQILGISKMSPFKQEKHNKLL